MYLRELIDKLIDELESNGNHEVLIEYDTNYDNDVDGIRAVKYSKDQIIYYITNNLSVIMNL